MVDDRAPENTRLMTRAITIAAERIETIDRSLTSFDQLKGYDALAVAYELLMDRCATILETLAWPPKAPVCGWCVRAAGDTDEAFRAAERHTYPEGIIEHANVCEHNPLAQARRQLDETAAKLAALEARIDQGAWPGEVEANLKIAALEERVDRTRAALDYLRRKIDGYDMVFSLAEGIAAGRLES